MEILGVFAEKLKMLRVNRGFTQEQLAAMLKVSRSTIGMYETGSREPDFETCETIADVFNVDMDYLMGRSLVERKSPVSPKVPPGFMPLPETYKVPLVGHIACGQPITAEENIEDYLDVPVGHRVDFALRCEGDSMIDAGITDGDVVYIRKQETVENGEIAAVRIGDEATLKKFYLHKDFIELRPANTAYESIIRHRDAMADIHIEGRAVGWLHWV